MFHTDYLSRAARLSVRISSRRILFCGVLLLSAILICLYFPKGQKFVTNDRIKHLKDPGVNLTGIMTSAAATILPRSGSILCFVVTAERFYETRVPAVQETWLKRCDHGQFFLKKPLDDETIPFTTVFYDLDDTYGYLIFKSMRALYYSYVEISPDFDWYLKTDDDTYIVMERLREFLSDYDPAEPYYLGYQWSTKLGIYHSGGSGYILSKAAMELFIEKGYKDRKLCPYGEFEDVAIGNCLKAIGIETTSSPASQSRFYPLKNDISKVDPHFISLHYQTPEQMRNIEKFLYNKS